MPSGEVAAEVDGPAATKTNVLFPYATDRQAAADDNVLAVQVDPSGDVAAAADVSEIATNPPFP